MFVDILGFVAKTLLLGGLAIGTYRVLVYLFGRGFTGGKLTK